MNKKIFLHIGMGKTGTTTLQYGLKNNYQHLLNHGWLYPTAGRYQQEGSVHHNVAFEIRKDPRFHPPAGGLKSLVAEISKTPAENIIISSEVFNQETIEPLNNALSQFGPIKVVVYLRRQVYSFQSLWAQMVKTCETAASFEEWAQSREGRGNYFNYLEVWAKTFGKENIIVRPLESSQLKGNILEDFLLSCGFSPLEGLVLPKNRNISPGIKTLEAIRYFTKIFGVATPPLGEHYSYHISRMIINYSNKTDWNDQSPRLVSKELARKIEAEYDEINSNVAKHYLNQEKLFLEETDFRRHQPFDFSEFTSDEVFDLMAYVLKRIELNPSRIPKINKLLYSGTPGRFLSLIRKIKHWFSSNKKL
jgi:hypothetical protein